MSAFSPTNRQPCRKKSILAKVCFDAKGGGSMRMSYNEYLFKKVAISTLLGLFVAKIIAIWCKTQCVLVLNAMRFDAKRRAFWC